MTEKYGALQAASQDAGSWQLIEQADTGEWAPLARGGKQNIVRLAGLLNQPAGQPPGKLSLYQRLQNQPPSDYAPAPAITRSEVEQWDVDTYMTHRGRLWTDGAGGHRDGSENGRAYTAAAAELMTGRKEDHPAWRTAARPLIDNDGRALLAHANLAAETARDVAASWKSAYGRRLQTDVRNVWPGLAAQLDNLAKQWADHGPGRP
jgi:hypothetical protein